LKRRKHCELTVVVHYSAEANHPPQYYGFQSAYCPFCWYVCISHTHMYLDELIFLLWALRGRWY